MKQIDYQNKLNKLREYLTSGTCIDVLQIQLEEAKSQLDGLKDQNGEYLSDILLKTLSKDISRYSDSFLRYKKTLDEMTSDNLMYLRIKIVQGDKDFFKETWKEDSDNFFRTRKFISSYIKDTSLSFKLNSSLTCLVTGLRRFITKEYGRWKIEKKQ